MAIDTHIYRVSQRLKFIGPKVTAEKAHEILEAAVAPDQVFPFHVSMINHGVGSAGPNARSATNAWLGRPAHPGVNSSSRARPGLRNWKLPEAKRPLRPKRRARPPWLCPTSRRGCRARPFSQRTVSREGRNNQRNGYAGSELARILYHHPDVELTCVTGRSAAGEKLGDVFPHLSAIDLTIEPELSGSLDLVFSACRTKPAPRR